MIYNNKEELESVIQVGDIVLVHGDHLLSKLIRTVTQSYWNHAGLYVGMYTFIESRKGGVQETPFAGFIGKDIEIYRHKKITSEKSYEICAKAYEKKGDGYDILGLAQLAWFLISGKRGNARKIGTDNHFLCSELVASCYAEVGLPICSYSPDRTTPSDIDLSRNLKRVELD